MPIIKVSNNGCIVDKEKVEAFIERVYNSIKNLESNNGNASELYELLDKINQNKYYDTKMIWCVEQAEDMYDTYINGMDDNFPF